MYNLIQKCKQSFFCKKKYLLYCRLTVYDSLTEKLTPIIFSYLLPNKTITTCKWPIELLHLRSFKMKHMQFVTRLLCLLMLFVFFTNGSSAQGFLKKLKDKANQVAEKALDKKVEEKTGIGQSGGNNNPSASQGGRPSNTMGEGLKNTAPPDVLQQITDADKAHDAGNFSDARYAIQQALLGVEIQIGQEILKSLPADVKGLPKDTLDDRVMSTRFGWANLTIQRIYQKDDKQLTVMIGNNPMYAGMMDMYFSNAYGVQSDGDNQNMKQIKVKGYKAAIKFDQGQGYSVLVPLGQSGMITLEGVNYTNEQDILAAAEVFDIDGIKKKLGEK